MGGKNTYKSKYPQQILYSRKCEKTPDELLLGKLPTVKHFRVFRSKFHIKNIDDKI